MKGQNTLPTEGTDKEAYVSETELSRLYSFHVPPRQGSMTLDGLVMTSPLYPDDFGSVRGREK